MSTVNEWVSLVARVAGVILILVGALVYLQTHIADPVILGTGTVLISGGAGVKWLAEFRKPPDIPPPEPPEST